MASRSSESKMVDVTNDSLRPRTNKASQQPAVNSNGWTRKNLQPYARYSKLYGERKFAKVFPTQTIPFLSLTAEIRNSIYRHTLCFGSIELSAKASYGNANHKALKHHRRIYKHQISPCLRILRLNKQVNAEAASIFYGENEFRFSSSHGHDMLFAFCRTIGKKNTGLLRKIVEHCPWDGDYSTTVGYLDRPATASASCFRGFQCLVAGLGLHGKSYEARKFNILRMLTRTRGGIEEYTLVIPYTYNLHHSEDFKKYNKSRALLPGLLKKNPSARITVANLRTKNDQLTSSSWGLWQVSEEQADLRDELEREALRQGWEVMEVQYDSLGRYSLEVLDDGENDEEDEDEAALLEI